MPSFSSWLYLVVVVAALLDAFGVPYAGNTAIGALALFIALEVRRVAWPQLLIAAVLLSCGFATAAAAGQLPETLAKGLKTSLPFLVLFGAVAWLNVPASESASLRAARDAVAGQPPGWRFVTLAAAAHLLGSVFNLVAVSLLSVLIGNQDKPDTRRRLARALLQGFATATCWSPLFVGTAVILSILPGARWIEIAPLGAALSLLLLALAWFADRALNPARVPLGAARAPMPGWAVRRIAVLVTVLLVLAMGMVEATGLSIPIVMGLIGPPFALVWQALRRRASAAALSAVAATAGRVARGLETLRTETLMFSAANIFSSAIALVVPGDAALAALSRLELGPDGMIVLLALGLVMASAMGLHPVIVVMLIGQLLPAEIFGLPPSLLALVLMALWGMGTNASPFSATNIIMSRAVGMGHWAIAWRWNLPFSLAGAAVVALAGIALRRVAM
ncbi:MAG: hypothetical protein FJX42_03985 [Alphaproteobacteria bacterium]|nr:hypothetical protein [Alphaproteobacteria bacterium]